MLLELMVSFLSLRILSPPPPAPTSTCSSMQYIQTALSRSAVAPCYFPVSGNCSTLTCPMSRGQDLTLRILRCTHPPAVRITYGTGLNTLFDHTFDHSEVVPLQAGVALNVTLDQLCSSNSIGLEVSGVGQAHTRFIHNRYVMHHPCTVDPLR